MDQYLVTGMSCAACQAHVEKAVSKVPGVKNVSVSLLTNSMAVEGTAAPGDIIRAVEEAGYGASVKGAEQKKESASEKLAAEEDALKDRETPRLVRRLALSIGFLLLLMYLTMGHNMLGWPLPAFLDGNPIGIGLTELLLALIVMAVNRAFFVSGFRSVLHGAPNMDTLVALGSGVSFLWSLYVLFRMTWMSANGADSMALMDLLHNELYFESAAMIPALITVGKTLEAYSKGRTTDALKNLMKMAPKTAVVERNGAAVEVPVDEVIPGDIFDVKPGESIPVDGVIIEGSTAVDESALTGESIPVDKTVSDSVSAATINQSGFIRAKASRVGEDTTFSQIIQMVSDAAATKAPIARIADRVSAVFVPAVILIALAVLLIWLLRGQTAAFALERAISVLVISCPCALGLATPVAIMVGNGVGAKNGILFKTSEALENAGKIQIAALDKTGTVTAGKPAVTDLIPAENVTEEELLTKAYALEKKSEHPLSRAVTAEAQARHIEAPEVTDFRALAGHGLTAKLGDQVLLGGSGSFLTGQTAVPESAQRQAEELASAGKTPLFFAENGVFLGIIAVADTIKEDSAQAVRELRNMGVEVVMLTGDNERTARAIGKEAGVDRVIAGVLPDGKESEIRKLMKRGRTAMVGDGINDAPALTRADTGIAIGAGTDVAIDSADIVLMNSKLTDVSAAVRLSRAVLRNIHENLFWAFAYNAILIPMAAGLYPGIRMNPMWGAAAMSLSSFTVCMNALRLNLCRIHDASHDRPMKKRALPEQDVQEQTGAAQAESAAEAQAEIPAEGTAGQGSGSAACSTAACRMIKLNSQEENDMTETVKIEGMMCEHCEATVKKALEKLDGVEKAEVSHEKGNAVLTLSKEVPEEEIKKAVEDHDYTYKGIA